MRTFCILNIIIFFSVFTESSKRVIKEEEKAELEHREKSDENPKKTEQTDPKTKAKSESETESKSAKWFSLNPGVMIDSVAVDVSGRAGSAVMTQDGIGRVTWMFDIKSRDYQIFEKFGTHLLIHNSGFYLDRQFLPEFKSEGASASSEKGSSGSSSSSGSSGSRTKQDAGTRIDGSYSMFLPILYFGKKGSENYRIGFGAGPANVNMTGSVDFQNPVLSYSSIFADTSNRNTYLQNLSALHFVSGTMNPANGDPVVSYLVGNLSQGRNLELLGAYYASKNLLTFDPLSLYIFTRTPGQFTLFEAITLGNLAKNQINISRREVGSFMFFFESPRVGYVKFRFAFGGPLFKDNGYQYEFRTFHIAAFIPIEF